MRILVEQLQHHQCKYTHKIKYIYIMITMFYVHLLFIIIKFYTFVTFVIFRIPSSAIILQAYFNLVKS